MNTLELVLGTNGRSGGQWDIWQAVYSPVGADGYPKPIWDKRTGVIDRDVASYWRDHYDLSYILRRDWATLGPKLRGKLHIYVGDMDNYYLNNAVYLVEEFLKTASPAYRGGGRLRRSRRALLERRSHETERDLTTALSPDVRAEDPRAAAEDRTGGSRHDELAVLKVPRRPGAGYGGVTMSTHGDLHAGPAGKPGARRHDGRQGRGPGGITPFRRHRAVERHGPVELGRGRAQARRRSFRCPTVSSCAAPCW